MPTTHPSLLQRLKSRGDAVAWSRFVELYTPLVCRWVDQLGLQGADRADVVQDVFLVMLGRVSSFQYDPQLSFRAWLRTVTLNKCRDFFRRSQRLQGQQELLQRLAQAKEDPEHWLTEQQYQQQLAQSALQLMKTHFAETTWRACWEHVAQGRPARDVAEELGISVNAVYLARGRVLRRLRDELQGLWE